MTELEPNNQDIQSSIPEIPEFRRFSHEAMATTFKVFVVHEDEKYAKQAALAAFAEVDRLENELSRFIANSEISRINNLPAHKPMLLGLDTFECLRLSCRLYAETKGAFDVTVGPLMKCWRNRDGSLRTPTEEELSDARSRIGADLILLNEDNFTIELLASPLQIDLGGIGKGYAVDRMADLLLEWGINTALLSGGFSSVLALEAPEETKGWPLSISNPENRKQILAKPFLRNRAIASSGLLKGQHIIDPRIAQPVQGKTAAWSSAPDAATADALSTAFMIMTPEEIENYCSNNKETAGMIMNDQQENLPEQDRFIKFGPWDEKVLQL